MRSFIAVEIPGPVCRTLFAMQDEIAALTRGRFTDSFHLTLAFISDLPPAKLPLLKEELAKIPLSPFFLCPDRTSFFSSPGQATVIVSLKQSAELKKLSSAVRRTLDNLKIEYDRKPFKAHITLGRRIDLTRMHADLPVPDVRPFPVSGFTLFKSDLTPSGPIYTSLGDFKAE